MSETRFAGFITPSKRELNEWVKRKADDGWMVLTFMNRNKGKRTYWGIVVGRIEGK